jgi:hypothetical protein
VADAASHARHDRLAIAASVDGVGIAVTVTTCPECGALHRDQLTIQTALRHAWTPRRQRLRSALWRRLLGVIGSSRDAITRPLAVGLTSVGIAGLVLSSAAIAFDGAASGAAPTDYTIEITGVPEPGAIDRKAEPERPTTDPILAASLGSLAAGGSLFALRRVARRVRGVR